MFFLEKNSREDNYTSEILFDNLLFKTNINILMRNVDINKNEKESYNFFNHIKYF